MNDSAATWTKGVAAGEAEERPSVARTAMIFSVLLLVVGLCASSWFYYDGAQALGRVRVAESYGSILKKFDQRGQSVAIAAAAGGMAAVVGMGAGLVLWRRDWLKRLRQRDDQWRKTLTGVQLQLTDSRKGRGSLAKGNE